MAYSRKISSRSKYARKGSKKTYKRKSYAPKRKSVPIKKMIRQEIARNTENKTVQHYDYDQRIYAIGNASVYTDNMFALGPDGSTLTISQGTGQGQRIGNVIKTKKLIFKGTLVPQAYDATFNASPQPQQVTMWVFYDKTSPTVLPNVPANGDFFQNGNSTKGFQGDLTDQWSPVNTDRYRVLLKKTFKLGMSGYAGTGAQAVWQNFQNNDFKLNCNFSVDLSKHYPQMVKFSDTVNAPTTRGLYVMFSIAAASGGNNPTTAYPVSLQWMQSYTYEDA